jgi:hypothetical protein
MNDILQEITSESASDLWELRPPILATEDGSPAEFGALTEALEQSGRSLGGPGAPA